jgi:Tir chaperone protein (CesT) family
MDLFQQLLFDLGAELDLPLHIDSNGACKLLIDEKLPVQLEMDPDGKRLLIWIVIGELPPGKFREEILKITLRLNGIYNELGRYAYIEKTNCLAFYTYRIAEKLKGSSLADLLVKLVPYAKEWQESLARGLLAPAKYLITSIPTSPLKNR